MVATDWFIQDSGRQLYERCGARRNWRSRWQARAREHLQAVAGENSFFKRSLLLRPGRKLRRREFRGSSEPEFSRRKVSAGTVRSRQWRRGVARWFRRIRRRKALSSPGARA